MNERFQLYEQEPIDVEYEIKDETLGTFHTAARKPQSARLNVMLFLATFVTTTLAGALMEAESHAPFLAQIHKGLPFSITLLMILLCHEFGHYFMAQKHHVDATLPYFIPAPSIIGTFGAVIKMRSPLRSKRALLDIGAAGPLAGIIIAIPATIIGLHLSEIKAVAGSHAGLSLGSSLLFSFLAQISVGSLPENHDIFLHPVAFAGWIGMLVTMLNLLPVGQLDGGHIAYAVLGQRLHRFAAYVILPLLFVLGMITWKGWLIWCALLFFVMGTKHPPTMDEYAPLDRKRKIIGWIALALFVLTFTPSPFQFAF